MIIILEEDCDCSNLQSYQD